MRYAYCQMCTLSFSFCGYLSKCRLGHASRNIRRCVRMGFIRWKFLLPCMNAIFTFPFTLLTIAAKILLEDLMVPQLVKKFPAFYRTRKLAAFCTRARHLTLSWTKCMPSYITKIHLNIIFPSKHGSSQWLLSLIFLYWHLVYISILHLHDISLFILNDFINLITFGKERKSWSLS